MGSRKRRRRSGKKTRHMTGANPEMAHWGRERRKSSAAQRHTPRPRKGTRMQRERDALKNQG